MANRLINEAYIGNKIDGILEPMVQAAFVANPKDHVSFNSLSDLSRSNSCSTTWRNATETDLQSTKTSELNLSSSGKRCPVSWSR